LIHITVVDREEKGIVVFLFFLSGFTKMITNNGQFSASETFLFGDNLEDRERGREREKKNRERERE
jgi:hypothetical protein